MRDLQVYEKIFNFGVGPLRPVCFIRLEGTIFPV